MPYPDDPGDVLVSLQDRARDPDASRGHVVLGALVDSGRAVFQLPPDFALGAEAHLEVLVAPTGADRDTVVERIKPLRLWVSSLAPAERPEAATALLAQPSRYGGATSPVDAETLAGALARNRDIWSALLELGVVTRTLLDVDASAALGRLDRIEEVQRRILVATVLGKDPINIGNCVFSSACQPWKPRG